MIMRPNAIEGIRAVLFDFDDTLANSERGKRAAHKEVGKRLKTLLRRKDLDLPVSKLVHYTSRLDDEMDRAGRLVRDRWWADLFTRLTGSEIERKQAAMLTKVYWRAWTAKAQPYADAAPTLARLKRMGYKLGIVTDTDGVPGLKRRRIRLSRLDKYFDVIVVAGEDCPQQKPRKEPFLMAASMLHVPPRNCLVVGDSAIKDVRGALAADMEPVLVKRKGRVDSSNGTYVARRLSDLLGLLRQGTDLVRKI